MAKPILAMAALALGFAASTFAPAPASALTVPKPEIAKSGEVTQVRHRRRGIGRRHFGHRRYGYGRRFHSRRFGHHRRYRHRRHYRPRIYFSPYYYGYGYRRSCYWLKRRAIRTGSRYWWRRYQNCKWRRYY